jgi:tripartite motif-containing protein 71
MNHTRIRRALAAGITAALVVVLFAAVPVGAASFVRTIGSSGHSDMYPGGLSVATNGDVYVADTGNDQVKKYAAGATTPTWVVGTRGETIQNGNFSNPRDVAVSASNVFVADTDQYIVQVLNKTDGSFVSKLSFAFRSPIGVSVGTDGAGHAIVLVGDGGSGNVEVFNAAGPTYSHLISVPPKLGANAGTRDAATDAAGNLYVADYRHNAIQKYSVGGTWPNLTYTWVKQWGGQGASFPKCQQIPRPYGVAVDDAGRIYVAVSNVNLVKVFDGNGNCVTGGTYGVSGTGPNQVSQLRRVAVSTGADPTVYLADLWGLKIAEYQSSGSHTVPFTKLGTGTYPSDGLLNEVHAVALSPDGNSLYAVDTINQRAQRFDLTGCAPPPSTVCPAVSWGNKGVGAGSFNWPQGIAVDPVNGHVWVADTRNNRLQEYSIAADGTATLLHVMGGTQGKGNGQFYWPMSISFDTAGNMYVADTFNNRVQSFDANRNFRWAYGTVGTGLNNIKKPNGVAYDSIGNRVLVVDTLNKRVVSLDPTTGARLGIPISASGLLTPSGVAASPADGNIWVADSGNNRLREFSPTGTLLATIGGPGYGSSSTQFNLPRDLIFSADGSKLYVADAYNDRVQVFTP